jgi:hypothetical protein
MAALIDSIRPVPTTVTTLSKKLSAEDKITRERLQTSRRDSSGLIGNQEHCRRCTVKAALANKEQDRRVCVAIDTALVKPGV